MAFRSASSVLSAVITPSPLNFVLAKILVLSAVSSSEMVSFSNPRFARICLALTYSFRPSASSWFSALSGNSGCGLMRISGSFSTLVTHCVASITSLTRILPSPSSSISFSVLSSNSNPDVGQLKTVHIFWSNSPRWAMSAPVSMLMRVTPPSLVNFQLYGVLFSMCCVSVLILHAHTKFCRFCS